MIEPGTHVLYAGYLYEVAAVNGDLLTLTGLPMNVVMSVSGLDGRGTAAPRCTALASDVAVVDHERVGEEG